MSLTWPHYLDHIECGYVSLILLPRIQSANRHTARGSSPHYFPARTSEPFLNCLCLRRRPLLYESVAPPLRKPKIHSCAMSDAPPTASAAPPAAENGAPAAPAESGPAAAAPAPEAAAAAAASGAASSNDAPATAAKTDSAATDGGGGGDEEPEEVDDEEAMLRAIEAERAQEDAAEAAHPHAQPHDASAAPKLLQDAIKKAEVKFSDSEEEEEAQKKKAAESPSKEEKKDDDADNDAAAAAGTAEETHVHARVRSELRGGNIADEELINDMLLMCLVGLGIWRLFRSIFWQFASFCTLVLHAMSVANIRT